MRNEIGPVRAVRGCERRSPGRSLGGSAGRNRGCPRRPLGRLCPDRRLGRAGNGFAPFQRRLDDLEVLGPVRVGEDDQPVAVVGDVVLDARLARGDEGRRVAGAVRIDQPHLAGDVVVRVDQQETARFGEGDVHEESRVRFLVDERVARGIVAEPMAEDPARAMVVVELGVEEGAAVRRPLEGARAALDHVVEPPARVEVLHAQRVELRAARIDGPAEAPVVVGMVASTDTVVAPTPVFGWSRRFG